MVQKSVISGMSQSPLIVSTLLQARLVLITMFLGQKSNTGAIVSGLQLKLTYLNVKVHGFEVFRPSFAVAVILYKKVRFQARIYFYVGCECWRKCTIIIDFKIRIIIIKQGDIVAIKAV